MKQDKGILLDKRSNKALEKVLQGEKKVSKIPDVQPMTHGRLATAPTKLKS